LACGNNNISRGYLSSQPQPAAAPLRAIRATLPHNKSSRAEVYVTTAGDFVDRKDPNRREHRIADVTTPRPDPKTGKYEQRWDHKPDADHRNTGMKKPYSHLTGKKEALGPEKFMKSLPEATRIELDKKSVIVIRKDGRPWRDAKGNWHDTIAHGPR
jgi:hypothetical protein